MIAKDDLKLLADYIQEEIQLQFRDTHLTGNLMETISVIEGVDGFEVHIPAKMYSLYDWFINKVLVYTGQGSYASQLDIKGSEFELWREDKQGNILKTYIKPHNHKGYIMIAINNALMRWKEYKQWQITLEKH